MSQVIVAVHDVQDTPPYFTSLPASVELKNSMKPVILMRILFLLTGYKGILYLGISGHIIIICGFLTICLQGDLITTVAAEDGDKQNKRLIRYGFLTDSNPFVVFFDLDPMSGKV